MSIHISVSRELLADADHAVIASLVGQQAEQASLDALERVSMMSWWQRFWQRLRLRRALGGPRVR
jgi:hypothetical protein